MNASLTSRRVGLTCLANPPLRHLYPCQLCCWWRSLGDSVPYSVAPRWLLRPTVGSCVGSHPSAVRSAALTMQLATSGWPPYAGPLFGLAQHLRRQIAAPQSSPPSQQASVPGFCSYEGFVYSRWGPIESQQYLPSLPGGTVVAVWIVYLSTPGERKAPRWMKLTHHSRSQHEGCVVVVGWEPGWNQLCVMVTFGSRLRWNSEIFARFGS